MENRGLVAKHGRGASVGEGVAVKEPAGGIWWQRNVLDLDRINVNILVLILSCNFAGCYCQGELGEGRVGSLYYFLQTHVNL